MHDIAMFIALFVTSVLVLTYCLLIQHRAHLHVNKTHHATIMDLLETHNKEMEVILATHDLNMRERREAMHRVQTNFDRLNGEYDWISAMYEDQMRASLEREARIEFLEAKLREFGQLAPSTGSVPFSAPASQIRFARPPRRARGAVNASSPLSQSPLVQAQEDEEE